MKKIYFILSLLLAMLPATVWGQEFTVDNIKYTPIDATTAKVTGNTLSVPTDVVIPAKVENAGTYYSVTEIGNMVFYNESNLRSITLNEGLEIIGEKAFGYFQGKQTINIPSSVKEINARAFTACNADFTLNEGLRTIGNNAFESCHYIISITIPESVTSIGEYAFYTSSLKTVTCIATSPCILGTDAFDTPTGFSIKVPEASAENYKNTWTVYAAYINPKSTTHAVTLNVNDATKGTAKVTNPAIPDEAPNKYNDGSQITIKATPSAGYDFVKWDDGNTDAERTLTINNDITLTATFQTKAAPTYAVTIKVNDAAMGTCSITPGPDQDPNKYNMGTVVTITATPNEGYEFVTWDDDIKDAQRTFRVNSDITRIATFKKKDNPNPPVVIWYKVSAPAVSGITYIRNEQEYTHLEAEVLEGATFSFFLKAATGITPTVSTSRGDIITPRETDGKYVVRDIQQDLTIKVSTSPVGNEEIGNTTKVWSETGVIVINTDSPAQLTIVGMNGAVNTLRNIPAGQTRCAVAAGAYIVTVDSKIYKVMVK